MEALRSKISAALRRARESGQAVRIDGNSKCSLYAWPDGALRDDQGREWPLEDALYMLENLELYRDQDGP
ncbi:MAG TPA: hypothetical protein ENK37_07935 [Oceanithermus profundus]|uniref:Uncharacterized protein n=1 Tax=Oceanithermus profundus TaxID=187137 RepID=A0A7C4VLC0_9DEIN|nr:hypothetical protein [Oceanithermus profundus]